LTLLQPARKFRAVSAAEAAGTLGEVFSRFAGGSPMDERDTRDPLRDLDERLDKARRGRNRPAPGTPSDSGVSDARVALSFGLRIGLELVVAVAVGVAIGWAFDRWLGTRPWAMLLFLFLGIGAGMLNVYRAVSGMGMAMGYKNSARPPAGAPKQADWDDED
jgi:ATP synthase protein I